jgi:4-diphosphocytidyl-2C-methyl-D-erythritol kinase
MVRKPGQKYGEGDKVKGLGDAVKALSAAVGDRYGDEPDEPESKPDDVETRTKEMFSAATKKMQNAKTPEEQRNTKQFLSNHQMIMQKFNNSLQDLGHSPDPEPEELQSLTDKNPEVKQELDKMNKLMLKNLQLYLDA